MFIYYSEMEFDRAQPYTYGEAYEVPRSQLEIKVRDLLPGEIRYIDRDDIIIHAGSHAASICADIETYSFEEAVRQYEDEQLFDFCLIGCFTAPGQDGSDGVCYVVDDSLSDIRDWRDVSNKLPTSTDDEIEEAFGNALRMAVSDRACNSDELEIMERRLAQHNFTFAKAYNEKVILSDLLQQATRKLYGDFDNNSDS